MWWKVDPWVQSIVLFSCLTGIPLSEDLSNWVTLPGPSINCARASGLFCFSWFLCLVVFESLGSLMAFRSLHLYSSETCQLGKGCQCWIMYALAVFLEYDKKTMQASLWIMDRGLMLRAYAQHKNVSLSVNYPDKWETREVGYWIFHNTP